MTPHFAITSAWENTLSLARARASRWRGTHLRPEAAHSYRAPRAAEGATKPDATAYVREFEERLCLHMGAKSALALDSEAMALQLALRGAGVEAGDEIIASPLASLASVHAIVSMGATPIFADCERETGNISPRAIEAAITPRTRAIVPAHFAGRPSDMKAIVAIARRHNIAVVEDCTHAMEASIDGHPVGTWGNFGCFSFEVAENLMGAEGSVLIARDEHVIEPLRDATDQDNPGTAAGSKQGMSGGAARAGLRQIERSEILWQRREQIWERYQRAFAGLPCARPAPPAPGTRHAYSGYVLQVDIERLGRSRDEIVEELTCHNLDIDAAARNLGLHTYADSEPSPNGKEGDCSNAEFFGRRALALPISGTMTDEDVDAVIRAVRHVLCS